MASMLRPEVIRDLALDRHGLRMIAAEPTVQAVTPDGVVLPWWSDHARMRELLQRFAPADCERFLALESRLAGLARHLEPLFMQAPPDLQREGFAGFREMLRFALRFRGLRGREIPDLVAFTTGSLGEFLDRSLDSPHLKSLMLANSLYGKHGGPYDPGTLFGLLFHLLGGGAEAKQGFVGHVMGGMGAITHGDGRGLPRRRASSCAPAPRSPQIRIAAAARDGVVLEDGSEDRRRPRRLECRPEAHLPQARAGRRARPGIPGRRARHQDGRALRQVQSRAVGGAAARERAMPGADAAAALAVHVRALARWRAAGLRRGAPRPDRGGALDRLPRALARRRLARDARAAT